MSDRTPGEALGTVQRVIEVLRHLAESGETTVTATSTAVSLAPSTCHRMLDLLAKDGIVERDAAKRSYRVGPEFYRLAALVQSRHDLRSIARPFLQEVVDACDETCVLSLYLPTEGHMTFAEKIDSSHMLRYQLPMNSPLSVLWGASGRAILAYLPASEFARLYAKGQRAPASGEALPRRDVFEAELNAIRLRGYAVSRGQKIAGAVGINAPVFAADGRVVGSFGVTVPEQRITPAQENRLGRLVCEHAAALSRALGSTKHSVPQIELVQE